MIYIYPNNLQPPAIYALVNQLVCVVFGQSLGNWIDMSPRLRVHSIQIFVSFVCFCCIWWFCDKFDGVLNSSFQYPNLLFEKKLFENEIKVLISSVVNFQVHSLNFFFILTELTKFNVFYQNNKTFFRLEYLQNLLLFVVIVFF
jgi:hypothetical protein